MPTKEFELTGLNLYYGMKIRPICTTESVGWNQNNRQTILNLNLVLIHKTFVRISIKCKIGHISVKIFEEIHLLFYNFMLLFFLI